MAKVRKRTGYAIEKVYSGRSKNVFQNYLKCIQNEYEVYPNKGGINKQINRRDCGQTVYI